jgi:hypothetical protein
MTPADPVPSPAAHPAWNVWSNPIFRRYCRSRLRPHALAVSLLITLIIAGFIVALANPVAIRNGLNPVDAARTGLIPLLVFQCLILFILGTAQVSGGMTAERDEGVIDYQRLIPMTPMAKVIGYLFGLPVREYVMFLTTLPFTAWSLWRGQVAVDAWLPLYGAVVSSTLLYHFTGLVTGTVVRNRRWAFLVSIGLVFCLYTVVPQLARFGLVFFKYLTIQPVFEESLPKLLPATAGSFAQTFQNLVPTVKFFGLDFSESVFTWFSQGGLIVIFAIMLHRKWRRAESHLLDKLWAAGLFIWVQILLLGNALPLIDSGDLFPSMGLSRSRFAGIAEGWTPKPTEAVVMSGIYGIASLVLLFILAVIVTPSADAQVRGWRRARKLGRSSVPHLADAATSFWCVIVMAAAGAVGWYLFTRGVVESRWYPGHFVPMWTLACFAAVMLSCGLAFQSLLENKGARFIGLTVIFVGVLPLMIGAVMTAIDKRMLPAATWLIGISPVSMPFYASASLLSLADLPVEIARAVPKAFQFWLAVMTCAMFWLALRLRMARKARAALSPEEPDTEQGVGSSTPV